FGVSASSAIRWAARIRSRGALAPMNQGGDRRSQRIEAEAAFILGAAAEQPDITLAELKGQLRERGAREAWFERQLDFDPESLHRRDRGNDKDGASLRPRAAR